MSHAVTLQVQASMQTPRQLGTSNLSLQIVESEAHVDDGHSHELEQALALIIVLLGDPYCTLGILGHVLCIASLQAYAHSADGACYGQGS